MWSYWTVPDWYVETILSLAIWYEDIWYEDVNIYQFEYLKLLFNNESGGMNSTKKSAKPKIDPTTPSHNLDDDDYEYDYDDDYDYDYSDEE